MRKKINKSIFENRKFWRSGLSSLFFLFLLGFCINASAQTYFKVSGGNVKIQGDALMKTNNLVLENNASINVESDQAGLTISGNLQNFSNTNLILEKGNLRFEGTQKQTISGNNSFEFNNVEISTNELEFKQNAVVNKTLSMEKGVINLCNHDLHLSKNAIILNETNENRIKSEVSGIAGKGKIIAEVDLNYGMNSNVAGLGIDVNSSTFVGRQIIERHHDQIQLDAENTSIKRGFYLPNFGEVSSINYVNIHYFPKELSSKTLDKLTVYAVGQNRNNVQINTEINQAENKALMILDNSQENYQTQGLSYFTLLDKEKQKIPTIKDVNFECKNKNLEIDLLVDRQLIGTYFVFDYYNEGILVQTETISQQKTIAKENTHKSILNNQSSKISEVVIHQYSQNGDKQDERVLKSCNCMDDDYFVFYGDNNRSVNIRFTTTNKDFYNLEVYNMVGNLVYSERVYMDEGANLHKIDASILSNSVYIIKMTNNNKNFSSKITTTNKY